MVVWITQRKINPIESFKETLINPWSTQNHSLCNKVSLPAIWVDLTVGNPTKALRCRGASNKEIVLFLLCPHISKENNQTARVKWGESTCNKRWASYIICKTRCKMKKETSCSQGWQEAFSLLSPSVSLTLLSLRKVKSHSWAPEVHAQP